MAVFALTPAAFNRDEGVLFVSVNDSFKNGGPVTAINLDSEAVSSVSIPAVACNGLERNPLSGNSLLVYCVAVSGELVIWDVNVSTLSYSESQVLPHKSELTLRSLAQLTSDNRGRYFFSASKYNDKPEIQNSMHGVGILNKGEIYFVPISNSTSGLAVMRIVVDENNEKLWVMSSGNGSSVLIDRIDINSAKVDFSYTINSFGGFDLIMNGENIIVSVHRTIEGRDLIVIEKETGHLLREITLPIENDVGYNALALIGLNDVFAVGVSEGVMIINNYTFELINFVKNNPGGRYTFFTNDGENIYAIDSYEKVVKIDLKDLSRVKVIYNSFGKGLTNMSIVNMQ